MSNIDYHADCEGVTAAALEELFRAAGLLGGRAGDKILRAFKNSSIVRMATAGDRLIGACRAITDGEYHAFVYDVAVHPEYQGRGIGKELMARVLPELRVCASCLLPISKSRASTDSSDLDHTTT